MQFKVLISVVLLIVIGLSSAISVSALSKKYIITDGDNVVTISSLSNTTDKIIEKAGFTLNDQDRVVVDESNPEVTNINIKRAFSVELTDGTEKHILTVNTDTVKELFDANGIALGNDDTTNVSFDAQLYAEMKINIDRVEFKETKESLKVPFETITKKTNILSKGETKVETSGQEGIKEVTKREKYVNGNLVESQQLGENIVKPAVKQVSLIGTKNNKIATSAAKTSKQKAVAVASSLGGGTLVDSNGNSIKYSRLLTGNCTAYTAKKGEGSATGRPLKQGNVAVDPRKIPYGTKLYICSPNGSFVYGYAVASDTGGAMRSGRALVDLYYNSEAECNRFGRRNMLVYVLD
ncbi:MAG: G5 domain-containing protein [Eubacteriales bacterium SKADARSKE-1]|nr:G5 domain-containing protein [Eubacteriales bacterium SKADARSKE-1]